jgi:hypothetical protein
MSNTGHVNPKAVWDELIARAGSSTLANLEYLSGVAYVRI